MGGPLASGLRLAELEAVVSLGTDLGLGQPMEHVRRRTVIALGLADRLGLTDEQRADVYCENGAATELRSGDIAAIPPGHDAEVVGDEPCVTIDLGEEDGDDAGRP